MSKNRSFRDNTPRITVITFEDVFNAMGTSVRVQRLLDSLAKVGTVSVISSSDNNPNELVDISKFRTINHGKWLLSYKTLPFLLKPFPIVIWNLILCFDLLRLRSDIVFCAHDWLGYPAIYCLSVLKRFNVIFEVHSIISQDMEERGHPGPLLSLERALERFFCRHSDYVIALSQNTYDFYHQYTNKIDLTHVFVDTDIFVPAEQTGRQTGLKLVGLIGPFAAGEKRGEYCLDFLKRNIDIVDSRIRVSVIGRCDEPFINSRIEYTGFLDSLPDYIARLQELDAVVVPEGISTTGPLNKILEPMSCSLPVFATPEAVVGLYWVQSGRDIFVSSVKELADQLNKYLFDEPLMRTTGHNARLLIEEHYSKKANEEKLFQILKRINKIQTS